MFPQKQCEIINTALYKKQSSTRMRTPAFLTFLSPPPPVSFPPRQHRRHREAEREAEYVNLYRACAA